ncbi:hypothetical protein [Actinokineospora sp.]|uniref:hypothetical protein n=1 Tax=Actinokineospora sp. TaxID=1872133 RepID=UPI003D6C6427
MTVYEKLDDHGVVIERVQPIDGDHTDTILGCLVLDGDPHWRIAVTPDEQLVANEPADDAAAVDPVEVIEDQAAPVSTPKPKPAGKRATPKE